MMASFGAQKAKLMCFPHKLYLEKGPTGKMWFSNLENPVCGIRKPP